jgi:2-desacetyl-2-hydroxyethyl bacteriochlorophyllide A dehydrogenase
MKTQALVIPEEGRCEVEEQELPDEPADDQVLVRNLASVISAGTELSVFMRTHRAFERPSSTFAKFPYYPGYSAAGEVMAVGKGVTNFRAGDRVRLTSSHRTHAMVTADRISKLPEDLDSETAAFHAIVLHGLTAPRLAPGRLGENVVVVGMGLIGNLAAQLYRLSGADVVAGADLSAFRLQKAKEAAAVDVAFNISEKPLEDWAENLGPYGAELVVDAVGAESSVDSSLKAVADKGRVLLLGCSRKTMPFDPYTDVHWKGIAVLGGHSRNVDKSLRERDRGYILSLLRSRRVRVKELITHRIPFSEAQTAYEGLRDRTEVYLGVVLQYP